MTAPKSIAMLCLDSDLRCSSKLRLLAVKSAVEYTRRSLPQYQRHELSNDLRQDFRTESKFRQAQTLDDFLLHHIHYGFGAGICFAYKKFKANAK